MYTILIINNFTMDYCVKFDFCSTCYVLVKARVNNFYVQC